MFDIINTSLATPGALAHRLQRRNACKIKNGVLGFNLRLLAVSNHFRYKFFDPGTPSMRKGDDGGEKNGKKKRKKKEDRLQRRPLVPIRLNRELIPTQLVITRLWIYWTKLWTVYQPLWTQLCGNVCAHLVKQLLGYVIKQAETELGQAQLQLELGFTLIKICCITLMITN